MSLYSQNSGANGLWIDGESLRTLSPPRNDVSGGGRAGLEAPQVTGAETRLTCEWPMSWLRGGEGHHSCPAGEQMSRNLGENHLCFYLL